MDNVNTLTVYQRYILPSVIYNLVYGELKNNKKHFIRRPPWVVPRMQFSFPNWAQWAFAHIPGLQKTFRSTLFWLVFV